ncbi:flavodoxin FldA [Leptolyngbyaceae cyanobacterium CCMR0082]|uniref:Flavodoxin n=2 Tax=Adonisia turfae TaxID=2950184 RepID=A0A6M0S1S4_9CYAN|nr:flavodoxin FldA [Adonisia turfae]MDV3349027.1 flavodoxin FldA [Leptothoe sp. LEGE 181152]NEZ58060.1 flavodoxin FldA [Adonisia turfae CCMR0081]NEZ62053.1 flavodoxin FldA [Adonisia turfae CCMR0082]
MAKVGLFYGSTTGKTADAAEQVQAALGGDSVVDLIEIEDASALAEYECLIIACPTWNIGELQDDWAAVFDDLDDVDFSGKTVAYMGTGDQIGYADNFMDAMGQLEEKIASLGGKTVGYWSADGYDHEASMAIRDGNKFCGLALDDDNESDKTESRIKTWTAQIKQEMSL